MSDWILKGAVCLAFVLTTACGDDHDDDHEQGEEGAGADACEHMKDGPARAVIAATTEADAPVVSFAHTRIDVELVDFEGQQGGYLRYEADEAAEFVFFLDADVPLEIVGGAFESSEAVDTCDEVNQGYTADLEVGPAVLKVGPTDATTVRLVTVEASHGDAPDHDDHR